MRTLRERRHSNVKGSSDRRCLGRGDRDEDKDVHGEIVFAFEEGKGDVGFLRLGRWRVFALCLFLI